MRRREALRYAAILVMGVGAGCEARVDGQESPTPQPQSSPTGTPTFEWVGDDASPFATVEIGSRDTVADPERNRPHDVVIWNDLEAEREIRVKVTEGETTRFDETLTFPPLEVLRLGLLEPGAYGLEVFVDDGRAGAFTVPRSLFDCNFMNMADEITDRLQELDFIDNVEVTQETNKIWTPMRMTETERHHRNREFRQKVNANGIEPHDYSSD